MRATCRCPADPRFTCQACEPTRCACGRTVPRATLRRAAREGRGVRCTACSARLTATEVAEAWLGI